MNGSTRADETRASVRRFRNRLRLETPSHPSYVALVRDLVYRLCLQYGFTARGAYEVKLVCGEALANIIKHAYDARTDRPIFIEIFRHRSYVELQFLDRGRSVPIGKNLIRDLSDYREHGLGLYMIGKLSDYHFFDTKSDGNRLVVKKRFC